MKSKSLFLALSIVGFFAVSCNSMRSLTDDNVYMMKTSAMPVGEDLTDETSYTTFKHRKETRNPTDGYYNPRNSNISIDPRANNNSLFLGWGAPMFMAGMYQGNYNPYWGMHRNGFYYGTGYGFLYNPYFYNGYPGMNYGMFNSYGVSYGMNSFYNNMYGPNGSWFIGNDAMYNNGFISYAAGNNCPGGQFTNGGISGTVPQANYVSRPRSTVSGGYYSGNDRGGAIQVKSSQNSAYTSDNSGRRVYDNASINATRGSQERSAPTYTRNSNNTNTSREVQSRQYNVRTYESSGNTRTNYPSTRTESPRNGSIGTSGGGSRESVGGSNGSVGRSGGGSTGARPGGRGN